MKMAGGESVMRAVLSAAVGLAFAGVAAYLISLQRRAYQAELHEQTLQHAAAVRAGIESELSATVFLAQGLVAYINAQGTLGGPGLKHAMRTLYSAGRHLRSIAFAPGNRVEYIYPQAGNEAALGLRYETQPDQWALVQRAMETREAVLAGPVPLVQGGLALINRSPVYRDDGSYWGMVSVAIDLHNFLRAAGLENTNPEIRFVLRGRDGLGERGELIAGEPGVLAEDPVRMTLAVPGGAWQLAVVPRAGWAAESTFLVLLPYVAYGVAASLSLLLWLLLRERRLSRAARDSLQALNAQLAAANHELSRLSETDPLTGIPNRRGLDEVLTLEWRRCRRHGEPLTLLMVDIDHFKAYNDTYGHLRGDQCLQQVAAALRDSAQRAGEFVARTGGEEFVVVLPAVGAEEAEIHGERVRAVVENCRIEHSSSPVSTYVTVSVGVATRLRYSLITLEALREAADTSLYEAKRLGRNRVHAARTDDEVAATAAAPISTP